MRADNISEEQLDSAAKLVREEKSSIRNAAQAYGVNRMTLARYITSNNKERGYERTAAIHRVFTDEEEKTLADHIRSLDDCFHGLSRDQSRRLALDYAVANQIKVPSNWIKNRMAGEQALF